MLRIRTRVALEGKLFAVCVLGNSYYRVVECRKLEDILVSAYRNDIEHLAVVISAPCPQVYAVADI